MQNIEKFCSHFPNIKPKMWYYILVKVCTHLSDYTFQILERWLQSRGFDFWWSSHLLVETSHCYRFHGTLGVQTLRCQISNKKIVRTLNFSKGKIGIIKILKFQYLANLKFFENFGVEVKFQKILKFENI